MDDPGSVENANLVRYVLSQGHCVREYVRCHDCWWQEIKCYGFAGSTTTKAGLKRQQTGGLDVGFTFFRDTVYALDCPAHLWSVTAIEKGYETGPGPRQGHASVVLSDISSDILVMFGGEIADNERESMLRGALWLFRLGECTTCFFNKILALNCADTQAWSYIICDKSPSIRSEHTLTLLDSYLHLFGGKSKDHQSLNDLHVLDMSDLGQLSEWKPLNQ